MADETIQDMPYKTFLYIQEDIDDVTHQKKFELVGEVDVDGNLVAGSPNLQPQHQTALPQRSAAPVDSVGDIKATEPEAEQEAPKRRGRPAKVTLQETQA